MSPHVEPSATPVNPVRATFAALCATLVATGLARFAYTPIIPALIAAGWFDPGQAAYLGAANLVGYLVGALSGRWGLRWGTASTLLRTNMLLATVSFFACAVPLSFWWYFVWRFAAGLAGGMLMVLAAPAVLPHVPPGRRGLAGGVIFTGVGLGIAASGTLVPLLLQAGLVTVWFGLGGLSLALTLAAWGGWPMGALAGAPMDAPATRPGRALLGLYVAYGLNAIGLVPHMVFLVDFFVRGLGRSMVFGGQLWTLFGLAAMVGPILAGKLADRMGAGPAFRLLLSMQVLLVLVPLMTTSIPWLTASAVLVGAFVPGCIPLALGRVQELLPGDVRRQQAAWSTATAAFAVCQAVGAYAYAYIFDRSHSYLILFAIAGGAVVLAIGLEMLLTLGPGARRAAAARTT